MTVPSLGLADRLLMQVYTHNDYTGRGIVGGVGRSEGDYGCDVANRQGIRCVVGELRVRIHIIGYGRRDRGDEGGPGRG